MIPSIDFDAPQYDYAAVQAQVSYLMVIGVTFTASWKMGRRWKYKNAILRDSDPDSVFFEKMAECVRAVRLSMQEAVA